MKGEPVPKETPPLDSAYHFNTEADVDAVAAKFTVPSPHLDAGVLLVTVGMV